MLLFNLLCWISYTFLTVSKSSNFISWVVDELKSGVLFHFMTPKMSVSPIFEEDILMTSDEILERPCLSVTVHVSLIVRCKSPLSHPKWIHLLSHKVCHAKFYLDLSHYFCSVVCVSLGVIWCSYKFYDHERKRYSTNLCFLRKYRPILVFQLITRSGVSLFLAHFCIPREFSPPSSSSVLPLLVSAFSFICRIQPSIQPLVPSPLQAASSAAHFSRFQFLPLLQSIQSLPSFPSIPIPLAFNSSIFPRKPREFPLLLCISQFWILPAQPDNSIPSYKTAVFSLKRGVLEKRQKWRAFWWNRWWGISWMRWLAVLEWVETTTARRLREERIRRLVKFRAFHLKMLKLIPILKIPAGHVT